MVKEKMKARIQNSGYKVYDVTFTENKKYNANTRTVRVEAKDEFHAKYIIASEFDSFKFDKKLGIELPTNKNIKIDKVKEIKYKLSEEEIDKQIAKVKSEKEEKIKAKQEEINSVKEFYNEIRQNLNKS